MFQIQGRIGIGVAIKTQIVFDVDHITIVGRLAGQIRIPVTYAGTQTHYIRLGQRRHQDQ